MLDDQSPRPLTYAGLFLVTLATLTFEILLTRIFSVTMWYHFSFMAISVAMFGMTVGALIVYLRPDYFRAGASKRHLALSALLFAVSTVLSFLTQLSIPFVVHKSITGLYAMGLTFVVISIPFVFSGICVCLALTRFPARVSKLYAADMAGAAVGCVLVVYALKVTDGPTAVFVVSAIAGLSACLFAIDAGDRRLTRTAVVASIAIAAFVVGHTALVHRQTPLVRLMWVKGELEPRAIYEKWNSFSRIRVWGRLDELVRPSGWGMSSTCTPERTSHILQLNIDAFARTPITGYSGDPAEIEYLRCDVTNVVHYLRRDADVLVIGPGGGRDILSALAFEQRSVLGVEINQDIVETVLRRYGDFTGHLDRYPNVAFAVDEARSYVERSDRTFDIIQSSLIDSYSATAAGAFVLTENSLYTVEAWSSFLDHLTPNGILTFSRWYWEPPSEIYRLASLASAALSRSGATKPIEHIIIVRNMISPTIGVGTILVSRSPFDEASVGMVEQICDSLRFDVILTPQGSVDDLFVDISAGNAPRVVSAGYPLVISAPTDNSPFFFNMVRLRDALDRNLWRRAVGQQEWNQENAGINTKPILILGGLMGTVILLTFLCILVPLILTTERSVVRGSGLDFLFFVAIGVGFMMVEISQMQRLIVFLGHPTYALSVVLFSLLISSGLGSYTTERIGGGSARQGQAVARLAELLAVLVVFGVFTPYAIATFRSAVTPVRIGVAVAILFPLGFFMGMAFPLGMKLALAKKPAIAPWLWGLNGATSVCASVLAITVAIGAGIAQAFWIGVGCYGIALIAYMAAVRRLPIPATPAPPSQP